MESRLASAGRYTTLVDALSQQLEWWLSQELQQQYAAALAAYAPKDCPDAQLERIARNYHSDHRLVAALRDRGDPRHEDEWQHWVAQAIRMLQHAGLGQSGDPAVDVADLAQVALLALAEALPSFQYGSRFTTWAYSVIARSARRTVRDLHAAKRSGPRVSLDDKAEQVPVADTAQPDSHAAFAALNDQIAAILATQDDQRLRQIFQLWANKDQRLADIGVALSLSTARVSALLRRACELLRADPVLRTWQDDLDTPRGSVEIL